MLAKANTKLVGHERPSASGLIAHSFLSRRSLSLREEDGAEPQRQVSRSLSAGDLAQASSIFYVYMAHASFVATPRC